MNKPDADHPRGKSFPLGEIGRRVGARLRGDPEIEIFGIAPIEAAGPGELSFISQPRYTRLISECRAAALILPDSLDHLEYPHLACGQPYLAMARAAQLFSEPPYLAPGIHPTACVCEDAQLGEDTSVGPLAHIGRGSRVGPGCRIYGGAYVGAGVRMGEECLIYPRATILDGCKLGSRVIIHSGTVVGSDGFGFAQDEQAHHVKVPQMGTVQIDDDVEIGANCAIDRATFGRTWIRQGTKIDNLVQIAHNVTVGEHSILVSQVGISGSARIGSHVILAGQVGVAGHLEIGDGVRVGAKSGVGHSVKPAHDISGIPAVPHKEWLKTVSNLRRLSQFREELRSLQKKVRELEDALHGE